MNEQIKWVFSNLKGKRALFAFAVCCTVLANALQIAVPFFSKTIVDKFLSFDDANEAETFIRGNTNLLYLLLIGMIGVTFIRTVIVYTGNLSYERVSQHFVVKMRAKLFRNIEAQSMEFYDRYRTGDLMTRLTGDLEAVRHMIAWVCRMIIECVVLFSVAIIYYFTMDWLLAICLFALCPVIFTLMFIFRKKVAPMHRQLRERLSELNTAAQENISGNRVVKAFAREDYEIARFDEKNKAFSESNMKTAFVWLKFFPAIEGCADALAVVMLLAGGLFLIYGRIGLGDYVAFSGMIWTLANPTRNLGSVLNELQRFSAAAKKIMEIDSAVPTMSEKTDAVEHPERFKGEIEFDHVSFAYDDAPCAEVLHDISFKIKPGETLAIMGDTGSGKTSLINMIPRFYDPTSGSVKIDGIDVKDMKFSELRKNIGMATQDVLLYSDSIDGNIAYGNSGMPLETVKKYAEKSAVTSFVYQLPQGFDTIIGERGVGLSGGQKQRISLARALAITPSILILDDTTSAVDTETEQFIQENLKNLDFECTKIIIAQRISSTKDADHIMILRNGRIEEMGTHDELLAKRGYYYEVYSLQQSA
ncbi:MAG: ABC transporter ATP-binding protein [Lachnospiraceae bacterium]|nr:ABC transporter ATP-binding protein [Lachnospiraceae bacterium]